MGRRRTLASRVQISWQAQHFRKVKYRFRGRRSIRKVKCRIRGRRRTFARSSTDFMAGAAFSQVEVQISWQAQHFQVEVQISPQTLHFCKVKYRICGRRNTFARSSTYFVVGSTFARSSADFVAGAELSQV